MLIRYDSRAQRLQYGLGLVLSASLKKLLRPDVVARIARGSGGTLGMPTVGVFCGVREIVRGPRRVVACIVLS